MLIASVCQQGRGYWFDIFGGSFEVAFVYAGDNLYSTPVNDGAMAHRAVCSYSHNQDSVFFESFADRDGGHEYALDLVNGVDLIRDVDLDAMQVSFL